MSSDLLFSSIQGVFGSPDDLDSVEVFLLGPEHVDSEESGSNGAVKWVSGGFFTPARALIPRSLSGWRKVLRRDLLQALEDQGSKKPEWKWKQNEVGEAQFLARCVALSASIRGNLLKKGVPISFLDAVSSSGFPCLGPRPEELRFLLKQSLLSHAQRGGWLYGAWNSSEGILGITPETLFERKGRVVRTHAVAGTQPWGNGDSITLLEDPKERVEHQWVIDGIRESLSDLGELTVGETGLRRAGDLVHLHAEISLDSKVDISWRELIDRLHPTPALGAYPRGREERRFLDEQEAECPRSRFGAPFGFLLPGREVFVVGIRNLEWSRAAGFCRIGAGAGFVAASKPEREWAEVGRKWSSVQKLFGFKEPE